MYSTKKIVAFKINLHEVNNQDAIINKYDWNEVFKEGIFGK